MDPAAYRIARIGLSMLRWQGGCRCRDDKEHLDSLSWYGR